MTDLQSLISNLQTEAERLERGRYRAIRVIENTRPLLALALQEVEFARSKLQATHRSGFVGIQRDLLDTIDRMTEQIVVAAGWMDAEREALKHDSNFSYMEFDGLDINQVVAAVKQGFMQQLSSPASADADEKSNGIDGS